MGWEQATDIWTALAATVAALSSWAALRWQKRLPRPTVTCNLIRSVSNPDLHELHISVDNGTATRWTATELIFKRPRSLPAEARRSMLVRDGGGGFELDLTRFPARPTRRVPLSFGVEAEGTRSPHRGASDKAHEVIYLDLRSRRSNSISSRLILSSVDTVQRRIEIAIKRTL